MDHDGITCAGLPMIDRTYRDRELNVRRGSFFNDLNTQGLLVRVLAVFGNFCPKYVTLGFGQNPTFQMSKKRVL